MVNHILIHKFHNKYVQKMVSYQIKWTKSEYTPLDKNELIQQILPHKNKTSKPESAKTNWLQIPQLIILYEELLGEDVEDALPPLVDPDGVSAAGAMSGDGAGAGVGGMSVPKIASGRRTLSTW